MNYNLFLVIRKLIPSISETTYWNNKNDTVQFDRFSSAAESIYVLIPILFHLGIFYSIKSLNTFLLVCPPQSEDSNTMPWSWKLFIGILGFRYQTGMKIAMGWIAQLSNTSSSPEVLNLGVDTSVSFLLQIWTSLEISFLQRSF